MTGDHSGWMYWQEFMFQEDDLSVEMNPTERPADPYPTTEIKQLRLCSRGMSYRGRIPGDSPGVPPTSAALPVVISWGTVDFSSL